MQCPNCRKIEKGQWLYANGCRSYPEFNVDDLTHDEDLYDLSYSEMVMVYIALSGFTFLFCISIFLTISSLIPSPPLHINLNEHQFCWLFSEWIWFLKLVVNEPNFFLLKLSQSSLFVFLKCNNFCLNGNFDRLWFESHCLYSQLCKPIQSCLHVSVCFLPSLALHVYSL